MCLLFFNVFDGCDKEEFCLVLVNNRDEFWGRPTTQANFWSASCISGLDKMPGREGGTWFGANHQGRIGCLVNIASQQDPTKEARGRLVTNFLTREDTIDSYVQEISSQKDIYNGFILTLIELGKEGSKVARVTNDRLADEASLISQPGVDGFVYSVGNSPVKFPWQKVSSGEERFKQIVQDHRKVSDAKQLKEELFKMMHDKHRYWPDQQLQKQGEESRWDEGFTQSKSSLFVWDPAHQYGTRTTTVLLVDGQGNCDYTEKTLQTPVNTDCPQWSSVSYNFQMQFVELSASNAFQS